MKIAIQTLGCKVNQSESASIEGILRNNDYEIVKYTERPDVCIVNTCTVTAKGDYESRRLVRKAIKSGARVIATGCYAQLRPDELSKIEGLDLIVGNSGKNDIINYLNDISVSCRKNGNGSCRPAVFVDPPTVPMTSQPYYSGRSRAFLKIQDGCNFSCSYCTIHDVLTSVNRLCSDGYKEIVLTGIHIGSYGADLKPKSSLLETVKRITESYPQVRIRLSSIEPREFKDEFLLLLKNNNICPHLHIPLQSGSDKILKAMNRGYTTEFYKQLINNIITNCPGVSIGTDVIAGFPGEDERDFDDTVKFIKQLPISYIHVFPYSKRPDTKASLLNDQISEENKKIRVNKLIEIGKNMKYHFNSLRLGSILDVIIEDKTKSNGFYNAISDNYIRVLVQSSSLKAGQRLNVKVISLTDRVLIAQPIK
jgi:threonylcarbamoyladenosine tRNA methylthiotransferase MtaB